MFAFRQQFGFLCFFAFGFFARGGFRAGGGFGALGFFLRTQFAPAFALGAVLFAVGGAEQVAHPFDRAEDDRREAFAAALARFGCADAREREGREQRGHRDGEVERPREGHGVPFGGGARELERRRVRGDDRLRRRASG